MKKLAALLSKRELFAAFYDFFAGFFSPLVGYKAVFQCSVKD